MKPASLIRLTLLYLAAPQVLFLSTWFNPVVGLTASCVLLGGLVLAWQTLSANDASDQSRTPVKVIIAAGLVALLMTLLSGASGVFHQTWDWEKHNAVLLDLARNRWPVIYELPGGHRYHLMYYLGYYLPAGLAAKFGGALVGQVVLLGWTALGTWLALLWFTVMVGARPILTLCVFPLLGGMDLVGFWLLHGGTPPWFQNIQTWLPGYVNFANLMLHIWSPQHALTVWLGTPLILYAASRDRLIGVAVFAWTFLIGWSILIFAVLLAVLGASVFRQRSIGNLVRGLCSWPVGGLIAASAGLLAVEVLFFTNGVLHVPFSWLGDHVALRTFLPKLALFYLLEFGVFFLLLPGKRQLTPNERFLAVLGLALLIIAPWLHFGLMNDLAARMAHVGQYLIWIVVLAGLWRATARGFALVAVPLCLCLTLGAVTPLWTAQFVVRATILNPHPTRSQILVPQLQPPAVAAQYLGKLDSWKWRLLAPREVTSVRVPSLPGEEGDLFASPFLLFNFRSQGIERDATGWWMWNRGPLELSYTLQSQLPPAPVRLMITCELTAADRERSVSVQAACLESPARPLTVRPGLWTPCEFGPVTLSHSEITLSFLSPEPPTMALENPQRREFAVKNVRLRLVEP